MRVHPLLLNIFHYEKSAISQFLIFIPFLFAFKTYNYCPSVMKLPNSILNLNKFKVIMTNKINCDLIEVRTFA